MVLYRNSVHFLATVYMFFDVCIMLCCISWLAPAVLVFMAISVESFQWWLQGGCSRFEVDCKNCLWIKVKIIINNDVLMFMWLQIYKIIWSKGSEHQQYQADAWWFCCNRFLCEQYILVLRTFFCCAGLCDIVILLQQWWW